MLAVDERHPPDPETRSMQSAHVQGPPTPSVETLLSQNDLARVLNAGRRTVERLRAAGKMPRPDLFVGKMPRWRPETIRAWIDGQTRSN
jgi:hypothetical protein